MSREPSKEDMDRIDSFGLFYGADLNRMREAAAFVRAKQPREDGREWLYHSRGTVREAYEALRTSRRGFIGGIADESKDDVRVMLDDSGFNIDNMDSDRLDLCWGGTMLSVDRFNHWYESRR